MLQMESGLTAAKQRELGLAMHDAQSAVTGGGFKLMSAPHPPTGLFSLALPPTANRANSGNLLIVQHEDTGVIQFVFQDMPGPAMAPALTRMSADSFGIISADHLRNDVAQGVKWLVHTVLNIPQEISTEALLLAARAVEERSKKEGIINLAKGYDQIATSTELNQARGKRVLLFVHGIFSSISGAFYELGDPAGPSTMHDLITEYGGNVFGYDHWTISKTPLENALNLLDAIPAGANWDVDVVCHSRGGLVVRSLLSVVEAAANVANPDLKSIAAKRANKIRSVGKAVFVAAANQGSPLANPDDIKSFLNVAALLASKTPCFALDVVIGFAKIAVSAAFNLQSVQELATTSSLVNDLNACGSLMPDAGIFGARADFDGAGSLLAQVGVAIDHLLMPVDNDLVVPYAGVAAPKPSIPDARVLAFGTPTAKQNKVWHTEFFAQPETHSFLLTNLKTA